MKKFLGIFLAIFMGMCILTTNSCAPGTSREKQPDYEAKLIEDHHSVKIFNEAVAVEFQKKDGNLVSVKSGKNEYLEGINGGNFSFYYSDSPDKWASTDDFSKLTLVKSQDADTFEMISSINDSNVMVSMVFSFLNGNSEFTVKQEVSLSDGIKSVSCKYTLQNQSVNSTVVAFTGLCLNNFKDNDSSLFWPYNEGEILKEAVTAAKESRLSSGKQNYMFAVQNVKKISYSYPVGMSMQLMQLFNNDSSIYYYCKDSTNEYKKLNFGIFDGEYDYNADEQGVGMSITFYPFAEPGETKNISEIVLGGGSGGWYDGSDEYRAYVLSNGARMNSYGDMAGGLTGLLCWKIRETNGTYNLAYDLNKESNGTTHDLASACQQVHGIGIHTLYAMGWHEEGFDTKFPDYEYLGSLGGEASLTSGVEKLEKNGDKMIGYLNVFLVNNDSEWFSMYGQKAAVKKLDGSIYSYDWGAKAPFVAACPKSVYFQNAIEAGADRLARTGIDGCFLDQLMEMPATLCYDKAHGHRTPATAYGEGYEELLSKVCHAFERYTNDYLLSCEGICDAYVKYIDMAGMQWMRELGWAEKSVPEITRYTIPVKMLGLWDHDSLIDSKTEYSRSFLMGNPILYRGALNLMIEKYTDIYTENPDVYEKSIFMDRKGVTFNEDMRVGVVAGENSFVISIANTSGQDVKEKMYLDLSVMGYENREVAGIYDLFNEGVMRIFFNGAFNVTAKTGTITSYLVKLR